MKGRVALRDLMTAMENVESSALEIAHRMPIVYLLLGERDAAYGTLDRALRRFNGTYPAARALIEFASCVRARVEESNGAWPAVDDGRPRQSRTRTDG